MWGRGGRIKFRQCCEGQEQESPGRTATVYGQQHSFAQSQQRQERDGKFLPLGVLSLPQHFKDWDEKNPFLIVQKQLASSGGIIDGSRVKRWGWEDGCPEGR